MSDDVLRIIPGDPTFTPSVEAAHAAEALLRSFLPRSERVTARRGTEIAFVDCGTNLAHVTCPGCDRDLLADGVWQRLMDEASNSCFSELSVHLSCCGLSSSLDDLLYDWPCGFSRYVLEAKNPGRGITPIETEAISTALGCDVRVIWSHI